VLVADLLKLLLKIRSREIDVASRLLDPLGRPRTARRRDPRPAASENLAL